MKGNYVDGFVFTVPKKNFASYKKLASEASKIWMKHGALAYFECKGEDLAVKPHDGIKARSFKDIANAKPSEEVWFSFIVFKNRKHRDSVNAKVMKDPYMTDTDWSKRPMPFDPVNMAYGGFEAIVRG